MKSGSAYGVGRYLDTVVEIVNMDGVLQGPPEEKRVDPMDEINKNRDYNYLLKVASRIRLPDPPSRIDFIRTKHDRRAQAAAWAAETVKELKAGVYDYGAEAFQGSTYREVSDFIQRFFEVVAHTSEFEQGDC